MTATESTSEAPRPRPLSPHLQVYSPQWTSMTSIAHRISGVALVAGSLLLVWWLVALAAGPQAFATATGLMGSWIGRIFLFGWTFALFYHLLNGVRHLAWDAGYGFEIATAERNGKLVVILAAALTLLTFILGWTIA